tara:strand:- start:399 stop:896 length:498 start_codon:yes stop_codon:yes gene_type:complete
MMLRTVVGILFLGTTCSLCINCGNISKPMAATEEEFQPALYQKTMCFGPCPAFTFAVDASGLATLSIDRPLRIAPLNALPPGSYRAKLTDASSWNTRVDAAAREVKYSSLDSLYDNPKVTDLPATITLWDGKSVTNRYNGPDLTTLYAAFDAAMAALIWRPIETK